MKVLLPLLIFLTLPAFAHVDIPTNLSDVDRVKALEILGYGTNSKILSDPYPFGGYAGFEVGVQMEAIPVRPLANLGSTTTQKDFFTYPVISVGKGLYNNVDIFIHFLPFSQGTGISEYGGIVRWGFFQMAYIPISFSISANADSANINNLLITKNFGTDLTVGLTAQSFYMYTGAGIVETKGQFIGGVKGITLEGVTETDSSKKTHLFFGLGFRISSIFLTAEMNHFTQPDYSLKLGFRY